MEELHDFQSIIDRSLFSDAPHKSNIFWLELDLYKI